MKDVNLWIIGLWSYSLLSSLWLTGQGAQIVLADFLSHQEVERVAGLCWAVWVCSRRGCGLAWVCTRKEVFGEAYLSPGSAVFSEQHTAEIVTSQLKTDVFNISAFLRFQFLSGFLRTTVAKTRFSRKEPYQG